MKILRLLALFGICITSTASAYQPDRYWIVFPRQIEPGRTYTNICLMQIDAGGRITIPPVILRKNVKNSLPGQLALRGRNATTLLLWSSRSNEKDPWKPDIVRAVIEKRTLSALSWNKVPLRMENIQPLQTTQRGINDFLILLASGVVSAAATSPLGVLTGRYWPLTQNSDSIQFRIARDGGAMAWWDWKGGIHYRRLDNTGAPAGKIATFPVANYYSVNGLQLSNPLKGNRSLLIYTTNYSHHCDGLVGVFSRSLNATTGAPLSKPRRLAPYEGECENPQFPVAIDPKGRFYLYVVEYYTEKKLGLSGAMLLQPLDSSGGKLGPPVLIADQVYGGVDLLLEEK